MDNFVSIIIPAYNEAERIVDTLDGIVKYEEVNEIIVIDDASTDKTADLVKAYESEKVKIFSLHKNSGKGHALNEGLKKINKASNIIGFLDADLGISSSDAIKLIKPILSSTADVTIAQFKPAKKKGGLGFVKKLAKNSVYELTGVELNSTLSGQRFFKKEVLDIFDEIPYGYGVEVGMTVDILNSGFRVKEVLVDMTHAETGRDLKGFIHRGKQYLHIKMIVAKKKRELGK